MRISEYKQALKPIPNSNLDSFVAIRSDTSIHFEPATSPPERWNRFQGTIVHAPGRTTPENGEPVSPSEIGGLEANTLRSEQFLAGFMQDLTEEFGADIAMQCFSHPGLSGETPITARTVREVIGYAEEAFDANTPAHTASRLKSYFQHGMWTGVISMASNPDEPRLLGNATSLITEPLPKSAEEFVIALISKRCLALPRQTLATLSIVTIRDSTLTLNRADGAPFIDRSDWAALDDESRMQRLDDAYQEILTTVFHDDRDNAAVLIESLTAIDPAIQSICILAGYLNPIRLTDGTVVTALIQPGTRHQTVTLLGMEHGHLLFSSALHLTGIRGAAVPLGSPRWLESDKSALYYTCAFSMSPNGHFTIQEPMRLKSHLIQGNWPNIYYPEPTPDDFLTPDYPARDDLLDYALSGNNANHVVVITALDALHAFGESPSTEDALSFCSQYIDTGVLACLGDISAEHNLIAQLRFDQENAEPFIQALNMINATLLDILGDHPYLNDYEDSAFELREQIIEFTTHPKLEDLYRINQQLFAQNGRFARLQEVIPEDELAPLREALERVLFPPDASIFAALKTRIIDFIAEEVLPGFIVATRERFASSNI